MVLFLEKFRFGQKILKLFRLFYKKRLMIIFTIFFIALLFSIPKIFLRNNIYYLSKDINILYAQYISLKEEKRFLQQQLEKKEYENQITDSLILNDLKLIED